MSNVALVVFNLNEVAVDEDWCLPSSDTLTGCIEKVGALQNLGEPKLVDSTTYRMRTRSRQLNPGYRWVTIDALPPRRADVVLKAWESERP